MTAGGGDRLAKFVQRERINPYVHNNLTDVIAEVRRWFRDGGEAANGYEVMAYIRTRWPGLTEDEQLDLLRAAIRDEGSA